MAVGKVFRRLAKVQILQDRTGTRSLLAVTGRGAVRVRYVLDVRQVRDDPRIRATTARASETLATDAQARGWRRFA